MIIFGARASNIKNFDVPNSECGYCKQDVTQRISVFGKYAHIFWIPLFPVGRKAVAECKHCKRTIEHKDFTSRLDNLYKANRSRVKTPIWHWLGLLVIGSLIAITSIIGIFAGTSEVDPRSEMLNNDVGLMIASPTMESDSISYKIKQAFDNFVNEELQPEKFKYATKIGDDKALILVQIPKLKKLEKKSRPQILEMIEMVTGNQSDLENKEMYIGVHGKFNMMLIKTPAGEQNSRFALPSTLYEFYGPKPEPKE